MTTDWADEKVREIYRIAGDDLTALTHLIAKALREAYERGAADMRERAARVCTGWIGEYGEYQPEHVSACKWASDGMKDVTDAIRALPTSPSEPK